jgi:cell division protein FtsZ
VTTPRAEPALPALETSPGTARAAEIVKQAAEPAPTVHEDVVLTPAQAKGAHFESFAEPETHVEPEDAPTAFIPPAPERAMRPTRMPRVEDLPVPAQKQLRAARGEGDAAAANDRKSLLQRLATVGFGRRDEATPAAAPAEPAPLAATEPPARQPAPAAPAEYARRQAPAPAYAPAKGNLDRQGRAPAPAPRPTEDDHLEIPAFLRRQSS